MPLIDSLILFVISLVANLLSALAGGGAGLLQLPALLHLGLPFGMALATHKIASVALGVGATTRHWQTGKLKWRFALLILLAGLPGVWLGTQLILAIPEQIAQFALGVLTLGLGVYSLLKKDLGLTSQRIHRDKIGLIIGCLGLFIIGILNGSLTSGTGLFVTIWLVRWFGFDFTRAVSYTLILVGFFWNGLGALFLGLQTPVAWSWLPALLLGSLIGGYLGAHWALLKGNQLVKRSFEVLTILVGLSLLFT
ncbi:MAG TPA: sulfite exporter TauE/SafE family protein [Agitococcus sp.]|uniref:sulfite exporter TauE/SafE family protein n=1 Tax=uncultured Agitococcus sp. TaxID=1506599 RepID=UPI00262A8804|nr:sulfite exporter TauE/SafE family protein [uncultured Agitococcus sp.]HMX98690.1 sulfite exporter TauE/SafE family protein [Agitococcus sp.]HMY82432.1 sulfite exporter TauE/SafE family protein [Agitococcus sp.]HRH91266.1 sulfite exporter TauE/SafE family protein [Agitococcus sp.]